jgi:hypothetical protein
VGTTKGEAEQDIALKFDLNKQAAIKSDTIATQSNGLGNCILKQGIEGHDYLLL